MCSLQRIEKLIFDARFSRFHGREERKIREKGNLANTFEVVASKQLLPFLLVDQAQGLETRLAKRWYLSKRSKKTGQSEFNYDCKSYYTQVR